MDQTPNGHVEHRPLFERERFVRKLSIHRRHNVSKKVLRLFAARCLLVVILTPGVMAAVGAIIDRQVFGEKQNPHFHVQYLAYSSLLAVPFILLRWTYDGGRYVKTMEFAIYILHTVGFAVAYPSVLLAGEEVYLAVEHADNVLSVDGEFNRIHDVNATFDWLDKLALRIFNSSLLAEKGSRQLSGRMVLAASIRIRQNRVKTSPCKGELFEVGLVGIEQGCYPPFSSNSEMTSPFSDLNSTFTDLPFKTFSGSVNPRDVITETRLGRFPLAGYWIFLPLDATYDDVRLQLEAMRRANWIDSHTKFFNVEFTLFFPDMEPVMWGIVHYGIDVSQNGRLVPNPPLRVFNPVPKTEPLLTRFSAPDGSPIRGLRALSFLARLIQRTYAERILNGTIGSLPVDITLPAGDGPECIIVTGKEFFIPFYLGMFTATIYMFCIHCIQVVHDWRSYLKHMFTYAELAWMAMLIGSWVLRLASTAVLPCTMNLVAQNPLAGTETLEDVARTSIAVRFELQAGAVFWQESRNFLGLAFFLHLLIFLKFLVHFTDLGTVVRTLQAAGTELASFSISFLVIFMAFVTMFYTLFSLQTVEFSSFLRSVSSLWLGMLGELQVTDQMWTRKEWLFPW